jgi:hypothetical protein
LGVLSAMTVVLGAGRLSRQPDCVAFRQRPEQGLAAREIGRVRERELHVERAAELFHHFAWFPAHHKQCGRYGAVRRARRVRDVPLSG